LKYADSDPWIGDDVWELEIGLEDPRQEPPVWLLAVAVTDLGGSGFGSALPDYAQEVEASPGSVNGWGRERA
jgi:hypothetical protein